jgi:purine nucleosidase
MRLLRIGVLGFFSLIGIITCLANPSKVSPPKVIIDTDFNTIFDDGQVGAMAAQLFADGTIDLLGFTIATGNEWRDQEVAECLKAVERMGIEKYVKPIFDSLKN